MKFFGKIDYSKPVAIVLLDASETFGINGCIKIEDHYGPLNTLAFTAENIALLPDKIAEIAQEASEGSCFHFYQLTHHTQFPHLPKNYSTYGASTLTDTKGNQKVIHDRVLIEELNKLPGGSKKMIAYWGGCSVSPLVASHFKLTTIEGIHRDAVFLGNLPIFLSALSNSSDPETIKDLFENNPLLRVQSAFAKTLNLGIGYVISNSTANGFRPRVFNCKNWQTFIDNKRLHVYEQLP